MRHKMSTTVRSIEDLEFVTLIWNQTGRPGEVIPNSNGVTVSHVTQCTLGAVEFRFKDRTIPVIAGQELTLPLNRGYDVVVTISPAAVTCLYPKRSLTRLPDGRHLELEHLESVEPISWPTTTFAREREQIDTSLVRITTVPIPTRG